MQNFQSPSSADPEGPPNGPIAVHEVPDADTPPVEHVESSPPDSHLFVQAWDAHAVAMHKLEERRQRQRSLRVVREVVETGILALIIFLGVRGIVQNFRVEGLSMDPTYGTGQYVLVNKALYMRLDLGPLTDWLPFGSNVDGGHYLFRAPERGDVVVFEPPIANRGDRDFIKRIVGEPGDHIVVKDGQVSLNGRLLDERYLPAGLQTTCVGQWCDIRLGDDEYFVMGDNRANSSDSRLWGPVKGDRIIGKSWLIYLPFSDFGLAPNGGPVITGDGSSQAP